MHSAPRERALLASGALGEALHGPDMHRKEGLDRRVYLAQTDVWQAEGRLRAPFGGGAAELPGVRLMASGLPHAQWNNGDVIDAAQVRIDDVREWYAARANGRGVPWGLRVAADVPFAHGRRMFRKRCMALLPQRQQQRDSSPGVHIDAALPSDLDDVVRIDAACYGATTEEMRPWIEPQIGAPGCTIAVARVDGAAVGIATAKLTDGLAGPSVGIFGVGVVEHVRRRGIATALTAWLLARAWDEGATLAHLNPDSDEAARVYARMGFEETAGLDIYGHV